MVLPRIWIPSVAGNVLNILLRNIIILVGSFLITSWYHLEMNLTFN